MSAYTWLSMSHALLGVVALLSFWSAGGAKKGSPLHRSSGKVYLLAMTGLLLLSLPMSLKILQLRGPVLGGFLLYLLVITTTSVWTSWRAIRDKRDWTRFTGPVYRGLMWLNLGSALAIAAIGIFLAQQMQLIIVSFSAIGAITFVQMWRFSRQPPTEARWWLRQHLGAMLGNGVATHIAFLAIGVPRLLPWLAGPVWQNVAWLAPLGVAFIAGTWLTRKYLPMRAAGVGARQPG